MSHAWIGAGTLAAGIALAAWAGVGASGGGPEIQPDAIVVEAHFRAADGLRPGAPVLMAGVPVGTVAALDLAPDQRGAVATLALGADVTVPADSAALIISDSFFGGRHVALEPGWMEDAMRAGDVVEYTQDAILLEDLLLQIAAARAGGAE